MGRSEELVELYDGTLTNFNFTWYVYMELLPKLRRMREKGQLLQDQSKPYLFEHIQGMYRGETDKEGRPCGKGMIEKSNKQTYHSTFLDGKMEGIAVCYRPGMDVTQV